MTVIFSSKEVVFDGESTMSVSGDEELTCSCETSNASSKLLSCSNGGISDEDDGVIVAKGKTDSLKTTSREKEMAPVSILYTRQPFFPIG